MSSIHPGFTGRNGNGDLEPLSVSPRQARLLLGVGNTRLYELIRDGELSTYREGRARRITMQSIRARVSRLADGNSTNPQPHGRSRPRRSSADGVSP